MAQLFSNNALTLLAAPLLAGDMQILVKSGAGDLFPSIPLPIPNDFGITPPQEDYFVITIENQTATVREVISIIGREGDVLYVGSRGIEQTSPTDWELNSIVELRLTAGSLNSQTSALGVIYSTLQTTNQYIQQEIGSMDTLNSSIGSVYSAINGSSDAILGKLTFQTGHLGAINTGVGALNSSADEIKDLLNQQLQKPDNSVVLGEVKTSVDQVNSTTGQVKTSVDQVNSTTGQVKTSVDAVNSSVSTSNQKLDSVIGLLQQQVNNSSNSGGSTTLNTEQLEGILQALIMLNQRPNPRLDSANRMVIDASETLVSLNSTTALTVNSTDVGTTVGSNTVIFDPFSNPSIFYSNIKVV